MNNISSFEISGAMRDLAEKSLDQARQAFDNFISTARYTASTARGSAEAAQKHTQEMSARTFEAAEQNVNAALDLGRGLARAKTVQEAMQLQTEYARCQLAAMQAQAKEFGGMAQTAMQQGAEQSRSAMQEGIDQTREAVAQEAEATRETGNNVYELGRSGAP